MDFGGGEIDEIFTISKFIKYDSNNNLLETIHYGSDFDEIMYKEKYKYNSNGDIIELLELDYLENFGGEFKLSKKTITEYKY